MHAKNVRTVSVCPIADLLLVDALAPVIRRPLIATSSLLKALLQHACYILLLLYQAMMGLTFNIHELWGSALHDPNRPDLHAISHLACAYPLHPTDPASWWPNDFHQL